MNTSSKIWWRCLLALGLAGAVAYVVVQRNALGKLREEQAALAANGDEAARLTRENDELRSLHGNSTEAAQLREQNKDLPRLRNEARQLRRKMDEWTALKAENDRLRSRQTEMASGGGAPARPPGFVAKNTLYDAGLATPEAALKTMIWAWSQGNLERMGQCLTPDQLADFKKEMEEHREEMARIGAALPGYRIVDTNSVSADELIYKVELIPGEEDGTTMHVIRVGNEWRVSPK